MTENSRRALIVVDVQNDFCEGGSLAVAGGAAVAAGITDHLRSSAGRYELVVASRDWHEPHTDNGGHFPADGAEPSFTDTWPVHCVQGTAGSDYHPALDVSLLHAHVVKGLGEPAYSAFQGFLVFDGVADRARTLPALLADGGITHVDVVGIATDYCVRQTALDALTAGFTVTLLSDLTAGVAHASTEAALAEVAAHPNGNVAPATAPLG